MESIEFVTESDILVMLQPEISLHKHAPGLDDLICLICLIWVFRNRDHVGRIKALKHRSIKAAGVYISMSRLKAPKTTIQLQLFFFCLFCWLATFTTLHPNFTRFSPSFHGRQRSCVAGGFHPRHVCSCVLGLGWRVSWQSSSEFSEWDGLFPFYQVSPGIGGTFFRTFYICVMRLSSFLLVSFSTKASC